MKRLLLIAFLACLSGCGIPSFQDLDVRDARMTNNVAAMTLEATVTTAELLYELEQRLVIANALKEEGVTKTIIRRRLEAVRTLWSPVWSMVDRAREAQGKMAAALELGEGLAASAAAIEYAAAEAGLGAAIKDARTRVLKEKR